MFENRTDLYEELLEPLIYNIKQGHQYTRNLHSFILSHVVTIILLRDWSLIVGRGKTFHDLAFLKVETFSPPPPQYG